MLFLNNMKELIKLCERGNHLSLLKQKEVKERIEKARLLLQPFGIDCLCKNDWDYFNLMICYQGVLNKSKIEEAYEEISREMFEIWNDLDYKKRNEFAVNALASMKEEMLSFNTKESRIFIPFFDELMNTLYDKETAILQLPQFFKLYKDFKERMIDVFTYRHLPFEAGFLPVQFICAYENGFGFYCADNHSIYVINDQKQVLVLPLSLTRRVDQLDTERASKWVEAALKNDKIAMVQWCINSGQIDEEVTKKCIKLLEKIKKELR